MKLVIGNFFYQYLATATGCLSIICAGMHFGWPSPSLPELLQINSTIPITNEEGSWLASMPCIGAASGSILTAFIVDRIGRKMCMLITSPIYLITWLMVAFAPSVTILYIARFLAGTSDGIAFTAFPMYLGEIADSNIRGLLGSSIQLSMYAGILFVNLIGVHLNISITATIAAVFPILHFISFYFMPESPYYYLMQNKTEEARKSLQILNGFLNIEDKLKVMQETVKCTENSLRNSLTLFTLSSNRRAVLIAFGLRAIQQLAGVNTITFYAKIIFHNSDKVFSSTTSTILYFVLQFIVGIISSLLVDRIGRKPLLLFSVIGSGFALATEAIYFYLKDYDYDLNNLNFVPVIALLFYVIIFNLGMGTVPVLMLSELFPTNVKGLALCLADIWFGFIVTVASKFFQIMKDNFGLYVPFFTFANCCIVGFVFILYFVPETKGKTLEEIQEYLKGERSKQSSNTNLV